MIEETNDKRVGRMQPATMREASGSEETFKVAILKGNVRGHTVCFRFGFRFGFRLG